MGALTLRRKTALPGRRAGCEYLNCKFSRSCDIVPTSCTYMHVGKTVAIGYI